MKTRSSSSTPINKVGFHALNTKQSGFKVDKKLFCFQFFLCHLLSFISLSLSLYHLCHLLHLPKAITNKPIPSPAPSWSNERSHHHSHCKLPLSFASYVYSSPTYNQCQLLASPPPVTPSATSHAANSFHAK